MRSATSTVRVKGPLAEFASGFAEELGRLGYTELSACHQLRVMPHLSRWMAAGRLVAAGELTQLRLTQFLAARREAGYTCWLSERGLRPLVTYLVGLGKMPPPVRAEAESPADH